MKKWYYYTEEMKIDREQGLRDRLKHLGQKGWELVQVIVTPVPRFGMAIFKRPVEEERDADRGRD